MKDWQQTHDISMAVQTAEMRLNHANMSESLIATCNLINIARGQSIVTVMPAESGIVSADKDNHQPMGQVKIRLDKRQMEIHVILPHPAFDRLTSHVKHVSTRPPVIKIEVSEALAVSVDGDLRIDEEMTLDIVDLMVTIPIR
jgi:hypothetical protein